MAPGKALDGKPYAGNPHVAPSQCYMHRRGEASEGTLPKATRRARKRVRGTGRFDEGEVAQAAKPRRGSLLYTRRNFLIGGAAFASLGAFAGNRFILAAAGFKAGGKPRLKFGVLSDIHILRIGAEEKMSGGGNNLTFRHALEWFRSQDVDAVVIAGDMADKGLDENLMAVANAWYSVFPDGKRPDGRPVEKVFVTGNHDWLAYGADRKYPDEAERAKHVLRYDMAGWWDKAFHEPYSPIYSKTAKGYTFICSHWDRAQAGHGSYDQPFGLIEGYMAKNGKSFDPALPFFYVQHPHLKDTCYGLPPQEEAGVLSRISEWLDAHPRVAAICVAHRRGHVPAGFTHELSLPRGSRR